MTSRRASLRDAAPLSGLTRGGSACIHLLQAFCECVMVAGQPPVPRKDPWDATLSSLDGPDLAARFLDWYILEGHPGLKVGIEVVCRCSIS